MPISRRTLSKSSFEKAIYAVKLLISPRWLPHYEHRMHEFICASFGNRIAVKRGFIIILSRETTEEAAK